MSNSNDILDQLGTQAYKNKPSTNQEIIKQALKEVKQEKGLASFTRSELLNEVSKRDASPNQFPLDVFHTDLRPFINSLVANYDIPACFVGLSLLCAYSSAIGTAFTVSTNQTDKIYLPVWGCLLGISSSGKSFALDKCFDPLYQIQAEFDEEWQEITNNVKEYNLQYEKLDTVVYRDAHIPTLIRYILPDNPKGVLKLSDELLEWINGMNQLSKKEGTDEQFWISTWNCKAYSALRSGKAKYNLPRPFVNVIGGTQYSLLGKLFGKDRDTTGFIFRLLFARPEIDKICEIDPSYQMPEEYAKVHEKAIQGIYSNLLVADEKQAPKVCLLDKEAVKEYHAWVKSKILSINQIEDTIEKDIQSGILGKSKEYCLRFSAILTIIDYYQANKQQGKNFFFPDTLPVRKVTIGKSIKLAEYFYRSATDVYELVQENVTAPMEVLSTAALLKMGKSLKEISELVYGVESVATPKDAAAAKMRMSRTIKKWIKQYPRVFNAISK